MNRRSFMGSILALGTAPAVLRAENLMRIRPLEVASLDDVIRVMRSHNIPGPYFAVTHHDFGHQMGVSATFSDGKRLSVRTLTPLDPRAKARMVQDLKSHLLDLRILELRT